MPSLRMRASTRIACLGAICAAAFALPSSASAQGAVFYGPTPYLQSSDSPFSSMGCPDFVIEDFESGALSALGVDASAGFVMDPGTFTDSVDGDDGLPPDGWGRAGHSWWSGFPNGAQAMRFTFTGSSLPTIAGLVWTDCYEPAIDMATFEAFDSNNVSLGTIGPVQVGDGNADGETAEDRFFGVQFAGGIKAIELRMATSNNWELDHLQFGCFTSPMVQFCFPETAGVRDCPCGNPPVPNDGSRGCNNYGPNPPGGTGGATLSATGDATTNAGTTLAFHVAAMQTPCSLVVLFRGASVLHTGVALGGGVRCVATLQIPRMYKTITTFNASAVDFPSPDAFPYIDPWTRSGSPAPGTTYYYYAAYRNGALGSHPPCTPADAFNTTNAGAIVWHL